MVILTIGAFKKQTLKQNTGAHIEQRVNFDLVARINRCKPWIDFTYATSYW